MEAVAIYRLSELEGCYIDQAAAVYVDGFYKQLSSLTKDRAKLIRFIAASFVTRRFFVAVVDGRVVAIAAYSTEYQDAQKFDKDTLRELGWLKGWLIALGANTKTRKIPNHQCLIESVTTANNYRGQGIARQLLTHMVNLKEFEEYTLEVVDTNTHAVQLYERLGFEVTRKVKKWLFRKRAGYNETWVMKKLVR